MPEAADNHSEPAEILRSLVSYHVSRFENFFQLLGKLACARFVCLTRGADGRG